MMTLLRMETPRALAGHVTNEDVFRYITGGLDSMQAFAVGEHFTSCPECVNHLWHAIRVKSTYGYSQGNRDNERRHDTRIQAHDFGQMKTLVPTAAAILEVGVLDVSKNDLRVRAPRAFATGTIVSIVLNGLVVIAEVKHSTPDQSCHHLGLRIHGTHQTSHGRGP